MDTSELLISIISAEPNGINGRTAIQKLGYFASVKLKKDVGYGPDFYGPFSAPFAASLESLVGFDFVIERGRRTVRDRTMYSYSLTDDGKQLAKRIAEQYPTEFSIIRRTVRKCAQSVHYNINVLSWAAKVHFILQKAKKGMTYEESIRAGKRFGWKLDEQEVESAVRLLLALGLIKR
jgi:uncharacterized protein YwgA